MLFFVVTQSFGLFSLRRVLCGALPYRFSIATQSSLPFFLRRVLGDCVSVWFRAVTQSFGLFSLRRVLCGLCRTVSQSRRRVPCRFPCVVSWVIAFQCGSVPRRRVSGCFLCVVSWEGVLGRVFCCVAPCRDAKFWTVFPASCPQWRLCCVVPCRDAKFCGVFFASCPMGALPYRFSIATHSSLPFSLRRIHR